MEDKNLINNTEQEESKIIPSISKVDKFEENLVCPICNEVIDEDSSQFSKEFQLLKICKICESRFSPLQARWQNQVSLVTEDKFELERQLNVIKTLLQEKTKNLIALQRQVEERENIIYELKSDSYNKSVENHISIDTLKIENSNLSNHIKNLEKNIKNLEKLKINLQQTLESKNKSLIVLEKENKTHQEELKILNEKYNETLKLLQNARKNVTEIMEKMSKEEAEKGVLKRQINVLKNSVVNKENVIIDLNEKVDNLTDAVDTVKETYLKLEQIWNDLSLKIQEDAEQKKECENKLEDIIKKFGVKNNSQFELENVKTKIQKIETDFTLIYREYVYISLLILTEDTPVEKIRIYLENSFDTIRSHIENKQILSDLESLDHEKIVNHPLYTDLNKHLNNIMIKNTELIKKSENLENDVKFLKEKIQDKDNNFEEIKILNEFLESENKLLQEQIALFAAQTKLLDNDNKKIRQFIHNKTKNLSICKMISCDISPENEQHSSMSTELQVDVESEETRARQK